MKKTNHFYRFCALALSCLLLISLLPVTQVLADGDGAIHIKSAEDLRSLAHSCTLDSWSRGKTVVLDNDIALTDDDELPIPTFGGTFNGNGHSITNFTLATDGSHQGFFRYIEEGSPAGLFGVLQKDAVIKNLNVEGTVTPSGDSENIGGIVGENHGTIESCTFNGSVSGKRSVGGIAGRNLATGIVRACDASGAIFGQSMTGGIVGENLGSIVSCRGRAYVNIESTDPSIDLSNLNLEFSLDLAKLSRDEMRSFRGSKIGMIFQEPMTSLNPVMKAGLQIREGILVHNPKMDKKEADARALEMIKLVGIPAPEKVFKSYPHELSGGMRQRVMIAMALACQPSLLICDEPTTALDVTIQAQILQLIDRMREELGTAVMLITHDMGVVSEMADWVAVMYAGHLVEYTTAGELFTNPKHPYSIGLINSIPSMDDAVEKLYAIPGNVPMLNELPTGCPFHPRCPYAKDVCRTKCPHVSPLNGDENHTVACWMFDSEEWGE